MRSRVNRAFTLVEILIVVVILGILAAIVIPQFTSASEEAQVGNVQTQLQTIRSQIELFRVRNNGNAPELEGEDAATAFIDLRVGTNAADQALQVENSYGNEQKIYMSTLPLNPRNKSFKVAADPTPKATAATTPATADGPGWFYNKSTGEFAAVGFDESTNTWVLEGDEGDD